MQFHFMISNQLEIAKSAMSNVSFKTKQGLVDLPSQELTIFERLPVKLRTFVLLRLLAATVLLSEFLLPAVGNSFAAMYDLSMEVDKSINSHGP